MQTPELSTTVAAKSGRWIVFLLALSAIRYWVGADLGLYSLGSTIQGNWQLADPVLLQSDLLRTLLYLHSQPPLYNLLLGIALKLFGADAYHAVVAFNCVVINLTCMLAWRLARECGMGPRLACLAPALYFFSPSSWLFQSYPLYCAMTGLLVTGFVCALNAYFRSRTAVALSVAMAWFALLSLTRASYHFVFLGLLLILVLWQMRRGPRLRSPMVLLSFAIAVIPFAIVIKNAVVFDHPTLSTWGPMNLANRTVKRDPAHRNLAEFGPFWGPRDYTKFDARYACHTGLHPVVDDYEKSDGRSPNMNHCTLIKVADDYAEMGLKHFDVGFYTYNVIGSAVRWTSNPDGYFILAESNRPQIGTYANTFNLAVYGSWAGLSSWGASHSIFLRDLTRIRFTLVAALMFLSWWAIFPHRAARLSPQELVTVRIILAVASIHFALHVFTDGVESDRFVFDLEAPLQILLVIFGASCAKRWKDGRKTQPAEHRSSLDDAAAPAPRRTRLQRIVA